MAKNCQPNVPNSLTSGNSGNNQTAKDQLEKLCDILEELENPNWLNVDFAGVGCIENGEGVTIGRVLACKKTDSNGENETIELVALFPGLPPQFNYQGQWVVCDGGGPEFESEFIKLCDNLGDGTNVPFIRKIDVTITPTGIDPDLSSSFSDYQLSDMTPYTVTGTVVNCEDCNEDETVLGVTNSWSNN